MLEKTNLTKEKQEQKKERKTKPPIRTIQKQDNS
jgi:hypothetical protein